MIFYFLILRIAAFFGHKKARLLVRGQARALEELRRSGLRDVVWFHVASAGEYEQAYPLIKQIRAAHPQWPVLLTFFSPSGYEMRKDNSPADLVIYLPFATRRNARRLLDTAHPRMAFFIKYEFWPAYLRALAKRGIPTYSVSSIFRPRQLFFRIWGRPYLRLLRCFTHLFVQDEESKQLLCKHGITHVSVVGDTRFDRVAEIAQKAKQVPEAEFFTQNCPQVIVAGSTWPADERLLARYVQTHPEVRLILVPHEIHRSHLDYIFRLFEGKMVLFSQATHLNLQATRTLVVDRMGMLSSLYQYGRVAYVGGGFGVGIHNTIEAAVWGRPVIFGPHYRHFREAKGLIDGGAGLSIRSYEELETALDEALLRHTELGRNAHDYVNGELGATDRIFRELNFES